MRALTVIFASLLCVAILNVGTVRERHDAVKSVIGNLDDVIVHLGIIDDTTLHSVGALLNLSSNRPGGTR